jgi:hypothetical protein
MPNRREFLVLTAIGAVLKQSAAAQTANRRGLYRHYARCLPDFLSDLAEAAYKLRNIEIATLTTSRAIRVRQQWVRETFWKLVGGTAERTPLNARTVGSFDRAGYRLEKVAYESQPGFHVSANLYVPTTDQPPIRACCSRWDTRPTARLPQSINSAARPSDASAMRCWRSTRWAKASALTIQAPHRRAAALGPMGNVPIQAAT